MTEHDPSPDDSTRPGPSGSVVRLLLDQRRRWGRGERAYVEDYLARHPALGADREGLLDLIYNEIDLRAGSGEAPQLEEYLERFPALADDLRLQFEVHRAVEGSGQPAVPGYEIEGELGRGGMGVVYRARQVGLDRIVALKMLGAGARAGPQERARFRVEAEAVARLSHPNIVQVFEVGEHDGLPFFSMEHVEGGSLDQRLRGTPLPAEPAARLVATLARAMQHAHEAGVVHRDLKPANVLLGGERARVSAPSEAAAPEVVSSPRGADSSPLVCVVPKIADFGLARFLEGGHGQTQSGTTLGTPSYMAPEQVQGKAREVGPSADVWALGAILYECLTGRPPFVGASSWDTLRQVCDQEAVPPRCLQPKVPRDLDAVCLKCLEKEPARRYASAAALAADLDHFLAGEAVSARSENVLERLARTLEQGHYTLEFRAWSTIMLLHAVIVLVATLAFFGLAWADPPSRPVLFVLTFVVEFLLVGAVVWHQRCRLPGPRLRPHERQLCLTVAGHVLADLLLLLVALALAGLGRPIDVLDLYPFWALHSGLVWWIVGTAYWGRGYLFALAFFALAVLMPSELRGAPLAFGLLWVAILLSLRRQFRRLAQEGR